MSGEIVVRVDGSETPEQVAEMVRQFMSKRAAEEAERRKEESRVPTDKELETCARFVAANVFAHLDRGDITTAQFRDLAAGVESMMVAFASQPSPEDPETSETSEPTGN
jgi:hypothetical protein